MAINFLNTVDFNKNQLNFARIQNLGTDPTTANSSIGQIYFNTTADTLKQYVADSGAGAPGWVEVGSTTVKAGTGIGVTFAGGEATVRNTGLVTVLDGTYIDLSKQGGGDNTQLTADLSAVDGTSVAGTRFLSKDNTWDVISNIAKATATTLGTVELFSNTVQTVAANAVTATASRTYGVQFNSSDQMVVNVPWTDTNVVTYDLTTAPTGTAVRLTGSNSTNDDVTISGTTGRTAISRISTTELRVDLTDDVIIIDDLTVGGVITQTGIGSTTGVNDGAVNSSANLLLTANNTAIKVGMQVTGTGIPTNITIASVTNAKTFVLSGVITIANSITITFEEVNSFAAPLDMNNNRLHEVKTGVLGTDGVNLGQVNSLIAGVGVFKGGYDASTDPGAPKISGGSNIALDLGDYFVVTSGGNITFSDQAVKVEVGDFIFAEQAIAASSTPASTEYIIVIADANIATAGTLNGVGAAQRGVAGFDATTFAVTTGTDAGFVTLKPLANPYGAKVALTGGDNTTAGQTTFTVDVTALFTGADAGNCKVEVLLDAGGLTVYPEVTRNGSGDVLIEFMPQVGNSVYSALITIV